MSKNQRLWTLILKNCSWNPGKIKKWTRKKATKNVKESFNITGPLSKIWMGVDLVKKSGQPDETFSKQPNRHLPAQS